MENSIFSLKERHNDDLFCTLDWQVGGDEEMAMVSALVSVDYITATANLSSQIDAFDIIASSEFATAAQYGYKAEAWRFFGYEGFRMGDLAYGERHDGSIIRAWGETADDYWREVALVAGNVTRLDICVDCYYDEAVAEVASLAYGRLQHLDGQRHRSYIENSDGGQTCYIGSRSSDRFARIYDKGVQSGIAKKGLVWRYELELKGAMAYIVAKRILEHDYLDQINHLAYQVSEFVVQAGLVPPFPTSETEYITRPRKRKLAGDEKLQWLRQQVRPSVLGLISIGRGQEVLDALGLEHI